jgi:hypothetical protein
MLSGLGVAGAVLAAVVVTFTLASGIIAYTLTSDDPLTPATGALVFDSLRGSDLTAKPIVLRGAGAGAASTPSRSSAAASAAGAPGYGGRGARATLSQKTRGRGPGSGAQGGAGGAGTTEQSANPGDLGGPRKPVGKALGDTTQAVGATTVSLARRLREITGAVRTAAKPIAQDSGDALRSTVGATTGALARLLGPGTGA